MDRPGEGVAGAGSALGTPLIQWPRQIAPASPFHNDHVLIRPAS